MFDQRIDRSIRDGRTIEAIALIREHRQCDLPDAIAAFHERAAELGRQLGVPEERPADFELTAGDGLIVHNPDRASVERVLVRLSPKVSYAILTRLDGWFIQAGVGPNTGARSGWYTLERQAGGLDHHYRTEISDITEVIWAFVAFLDDDPSLLARFVWTPYRL